ncbi:MAG: hypothetical protein J6C50_00745 [Rickettsiales bacterium]|nr:hypothetical protein [Rickettsiales bacterium]
MFKKISLIFVLFCCISCATVERGYYFIDKNKVNNFDVYNFTKQDLIDNIGLPSLELSENTWLYYSYTTKNLRFLKPKIDKETILIVYFDNKDNIINFNLTKRDNVKTLHNNVNVDILNNIDKKEDKNMFFRIFDGLTFTPIQ